MKMNVYFIASLRSLKSNFALKQRATCGFVHKMTARVIANVSTTLCHYKAPFTWKTRTALLYLSLFLLLCVCKPVDRAQVNPRRIWVNLTSMCLNELGHCDFFVLLLITAIGCTAISLSAQKVCPPLPPHSHTYLAPHPKDLTTTNLSNMRYALPAKCFDWNMFARISKKKHEISIKIVVIGLASTVRNAPKHETKYALGITAQHKNLIL